MIYLDHHAAAPVVPEAVSAMRAAEGIAFANPSSLHRHGRRARELMEEARAHVARAVGARAADVVFTSGGTEAVNLGVFGLAGGVERIVTTTIEHPAVVAPLATLERQGIEVIRLPVVEGVGLDPEAVAAHLDARTLVAMQWVNHEVGTILPVEAIALACRSRGAKLVVDATQAVGKVPIDVGTVGCSALAVASHKLGGPAGAGALIVERGLELEPRIVGGGQERGRRAGTPDVLSLVGFGAACRLVEERLEAMDAVSERRDRLEAALGRWGGRTNGTSLPRVATVTHASFPGARGTLLVAALDLEGLSVSSGAACSSGLDSPSPVIASLAPDEPWRAAAGLRLSLGPETTSDDVEAALAILERVLPRFRPESGRNPGP
ncbi:MAG: cysteine desulfurase family protein [Polyangiales bacterium]